MKSTKIKKLLQKPVDLMKNLTPSIEQMIDTLNQIINIVEKRISHVTIHHLEAKESEMIEH